jgi:hypothetical protein
MSSNPYASPQADCSTSAAEVPPDLFSGRYDSWWWPAVRGCPGPGVLLVVWLTNLGGCGLPLAGLTCAASFVGLNTACGIPYRDALQLNPASVALGTLSFVVGIVFLVPFVRDCICLGRLYVALRLVPEERFRLALAAHLAAAPGGFSCAVRA